MPSGQKTVDEVINELRDLLSSEKPPRKPAEVIPISRARSTPRPDGRTSYSADERKPRD
jgi:hypothetical protein